MIVYLLVCVVEIFSFAVQMYSSCYDNFLSNRGVRKLSFELLEKKKLTSTLSVKSIGDTMIVLEVYMDTMGGENLKSYNVNFT